MASLWEFVLGLRNKWGTAADNAATITQLHEILNRQQSFHKHMSALSSRTSLAPEDVMAEAVRFAERHQEAFNDFIYKGSTAKPAQERSSAARMNKIAAMTFVLGLLVGLIVLLGRL